MLKFTTASARGTSSPVKRTAEAKQVLAAFTTIADTPDVCARPSVESTTPMDAANMDVVTAIRAAARLLVLSNPIAGELVGNRCLDGFCGIDVLLAAIDVTLPRLGDAASVQ